MAKDAPTLGQDTWFKPLRHSFIATNAYGALTYIPFIVYLVLSVYVPARYAHPGILAIFIILPNWILATGLFTLFAKFKSKNQG